jgi:hypothetical protein
VLNQTPLGAHPTLARSVKVFAEQTPAGAADGGAYYHPRRDIGVAMAMALPFRRSSPCITPHEENVFPWLLLSSGHSEMILT